MGLRDFTYRFLLKCGGYSPTALEKESREFTQPIVLAGGTVLVAGGVAAANWFIAGYSISESYGVTTATSVGAIAAIIGVSIVAAIDRTAIYQMDTQISSRFWASGVIAAARGGLVILVSLVTTHAIAPMYLRADLTEKAFEMREAADARRSQDLIQRSPIGQLKEIQSGAHDSANQELAALNAIPINIVQAEKHGQDCIANVGAQMRRLIVKEKKYVFTDEAGRSRLAKLKHGCEAEIGAAHKARGAYVDNHTQRLQQAEDNENAAQKASLKQFSLIDDSLEKAQVTEKDALTAQSSVVLDALLESSASARIKWYAMIFGVTLLELLALWTKMLSEKSVPGFRIGINRKIEMLDHAYRARAAEDNFAWYASFSDVLNQALSRPEVRQEISRQFLAKIDALVPFEISARIIREIERGARDVEAAKRRHPDYAAAIAEAWSRAIQEVVELLRKSGGPAGAPSH